MPPRLPRSPRLAPELRRRQIIDATLQVAERRGFSALTVDAIAREAGITRPVLYDQFGELDGLLRATLQDTLEQTLHALQELLPQRPPDARPEYGAVGARRARGHRNVALELIADRGYDAVSVHCWTAWSGSISRAELWSPLANHAVL